VRSGQSRRDALFGGSLRRLHCALCKVPCGLCSPGSVPVDAPPYGPPAPPRWWCFGNRCTLDRDSGPATPHAALSGRRPIRLGPPRLLWHPRVQDEARILRQGRTATDGECAAQQPGARARRPGTSRGESTAGAFARRPRHRQPRAGRSRGLAPVPAGSLGPRPRHPGPATHGAAPRASAGGAGPPPERPTSAAHEPHRGAHARPRLHDRSHRGTGEWIDHAAAREATGGRVGQSPATRPASSRPARPRLTRPPEPVGPRNPRERADYASTTRIDSSPDDRVATL
jgi:hypothetical protein